MNAHAQGRRGAIHEESTQARNHTTDRRTGKGIKIRGHERSDPLVLSNTAKTEHEANNRQESVCVSE